MQTNSESSTPAVSASEAVVRRIANREGVDPLELRPLYEAVDPDALDALVGNADPNGDGLAIEFTYHGHDVTVTDQGMVHIDADVTAIQASV